MVSIREPSKRDQPAWFQMRCALWPDSDDKHARETVAHLSGDTRFVEQAFVAESDAGEVIGFIELKIRSYAEGSEQTGVPYVEGWFVQEKWRKQGVGKALIQRSEQWAVEHGYAELASDAELDNSVSIQAHKALGFSEVDRVVCFLKKL